MQRIPLAALRAFAAVYESGGVRSGARQLQITHSSVSRHLQELEAWLGVALFENRRTNGRLVFTMQGQALGKAASTGLTSLTNAVEGVRELRRANSVVIATTASFAARWLVPRLTSLQKTHAWIEISVIAHQAIQNVREQGADLALRMGGGPWFDGHCEPIMDDSLYPVASRRYWNSIGERNAARALAKARLLHDRDPSATWEKWFASHPVRGVNLRSGSRFTSSDLVLRAAAEGLGVALARGQLADSDVETGTLIRPFGAMKVVLPDAYWLVVPPDDAPRPAVAAVVEWIKSEASTESRGM